MFKHRYKNNNIRHFFNAVAVSVVFILIAVFARKLFEKDDRAIALKKNEAYQAAKQRVEKTCGSTRDIQIRGQRVFCSNGQLVSSVTASDLNPFSKQAVDENQQ